MFSATVTVEGNLAADPKLRFTNKGKAACEGRVLVNERRMNEAGEWEDTEPTGIRFVLFGTPAEHLAESGRKGTRLLLVGTLRTESWADRTTGEKRTGQKLWVDSAAVSLTYPAANHPGARGAGRGTGPGRGRGARERLTPTGTGPGGVCRRRPVPHHPPTREGPGGQSWTVRARQGRVSAAEAGGRRGRARAAGRSDRDARASGPGAARRPRVPAGRTSCDAPREDRRDPDLQAVLHRGRDR